MKFGTVADHQLASINLRLPQEPLFNNQVLQGKKAAHPKVYVGAARWGESSWVGKIYPAKTPASKFREVYPQYFNVIELDATHYNIYPPDIIQKWASTARGSAFKFCPKFPQQISHHSNFTNTESLTNAFLESIAALEENLGPVFLQLSESFSPAQKGSLFSYLSSLPKDISFFLELRHPGWFTNEKEKSELFATLHKLNIGAVITDTPGRRDAAHMYLSVPKLFLRFVCNALHPTSFSRSDEWIQKIGDWLQRGLEEAYIFLHPGDDGAIPELAVYWIERLNQQCNLKLKVPAPAQQSLF